MTDDPRMFQYHWAQVSDGTWVLDAAQSPPHGAFTLLVRNGEVTVEWRHDVESVINDPDDLRWLALRLMEAAVLADCSRFGVIEVVQEDPPTGDDEVVDAEVVEVYDNPDPNSPIFDPVSQQWRPRRPGE